MATTAIAETNTKKKVVLGGIAKTLLESLKETEPKDLAELAERMRKDYQIQLAELVLSANVKAASFSISVEHSAAAGELEKQRAQLLADQLLGLWNRNLTKMMDAIGDGRVAFEKVFSYNRAANLHFIRKLQDLPFAHTEMMYESGFKGIKLEVGDKKAELPPEKAWWLSLDSTAVQPHGRSRFLGAPFETWKDRREALRLRNLFIKRFILRGGYAHAPEAAEDEQGQKVDVFQAIQTAYSEVQAGGFMLLPNDRDQNGQYLYDFTEADLQHYDANPLQMLIDSMDQEQLLAFGIPPKTVIEGDAVGSFALVTQQMLVLFSVIEDILDQFVESYQEFVIDKAIELNWFKDQAPVIKLTYAKLTERPDELASRLVESWLTTPQLSPILLSGVVDVGQLLDAAGIPISAEFRDKLQSILAQIQAAQAAAAAVPPLPPEKADFSLHNPGSHDQSTHGSGGGGGFGWGGNKTPAKKVFNESPQIALKSRQARETVSLIQSGELNREQVLSEIREGTIEIEEVTTNGKRAARRFERYVDKNADDNGDIGGEAMEDYQIRMLREWAPPPEEIADALMKAAGVSMDLGPRPSPKPKRTTKGGPLDPFLIRRG